MSDSFPLMVTLQLPKTAFVLDFHASELAEKWRQLGSTDKVLNWVRQEALDTLRFEIGAEFDTALVLAKLEKEISR